MTISQRHFDNCRSVHGAMVNAAMLGDPIPVPENSRWKAWRPNREHRNIVPGLDEIWVSRVYLVQVFTHPAERGWRRLSIRRIDAREIAQRWDELQAIKNEVVGPDVDAIEIFPKSDDLVCVANMRHLFLVPADFELPCIWRMDRVQGAAAQAAIRAINTKRPKGAAND